MTTFARVPELPQTLRQQYLNALPEPQEWFLEERVRAGEVWQAAEQSYAVFDGETLVEFFASTDGSALMADLQVLRPFRRVLCKSFDQDLINIAEAQGWAVREVAYLFRTRHPVPHDQSDGFALRKAQAFDLKEAWKIGRDFYASLDEVSQIFDSGGLCVGVKSGTMIGTGVATPVDAAGQIVDVGVVTRPDMRSKGYGSRIIAALADRLERAGKRPIAGCALTNAPSKAALEKAGFVADHRLLAMDATGDQ